MHADIRWSCGERCLKTAIAGIIVDSEAIAC